MKDVQDSRLKRFLDLALSSVGLVVTAPLVIGIIILLRVTSGGKVFFSQERVGKDEQPFVCHKFRTMHEGTRQAATHEISDDRVTRVGRVLRKTKLDEIPQLWNVLVGEMSLVGPRPCLPSQTELVSERRKRGVYQALPGITGLSQVEGIDMSDPDVLARRDEDYLKSWSIGLDFRILVKTVFGGGSGDRVAARGGAKGEGAR